jgi:hypothetical protein
VYEFLESESREVWQWSLEDVIKNRDWHIPWTKTTDKRRGEKRVVRQMPALFELEPLRYVVGPTDSDTV